MKPSIKLCHRLFTLSLLTATACAPLNRIPGGLSKRNGPAPNPQATSYDIGTERYEVTIDMSGDDVADFKGPAQLRLQVPQKNAPLNLLVVSTPGFLDVGNSMSLSIGIALVSLYDGDGRYVLKPHVGPAAPDTKDITSNSRVTFYALNKGLNPPTSHAYDSLGAPCEVRLSKAATVGRVACPEIISQEKTRVKFTMTWKPSSK